MLVFHRKHIPLLTTKITPEFGSTHLISTLVAPDNRNQLKKVFHLFKTQNNEKISIDSHLFDVIGPNLKEPQAFVVYLMIHRLSDRGDYIGTVENLMEKMNLDRSDILNALSTLEENCLIKITGINLLKIEINANWF